MSSREMFEAEMRSQFGSIVDLRICKNSDGDYMSFGTQVAWHIWQKALEIALPVLEQQESTTDTCRQIENDGWIEWRGGKQPVSNSTLVEVKLQRDGYQGEDNAMTWDWTWRYGVDPIIAYRVIENDGREG